jgi:hypothetical protein
MTKPHDTHKRPDELGGTNEPQHLVGEYGGTASPSRDGLPTGSNTGTPDVADPHPANEEHYDKKVRPGGANPPARDLGPNDAIHNGKAPRRPPPRPGAPG